MANKVTIEVVGRFIDNITGKAKQVVSSLDKVENAADDAQKELNDLGKQNAKPSVDLDDSKFVKKLNNADKKAERIAKKDYKATASINDKASSVLKKIGSGAKAIAKTWRASVKVIDNASSAFRKIESGARNIAGKTWTTLVKIKDMATSPLTKIKNTLFSIKSLVAAITAGFAVKWATSNLIQTPIATADAYSQAKIGFSTLLGETKGQQMMDDLDEFAKVSPFNTSGVISNAQKMLAMGWDAESIVGDMEIIGNAAASTGNLNQGLESIVRAMAQIKTKGKLSAEELNQLAEAGISAKAMLAEELGYGTGDDALAKFSKDQEDGLIGADKALQALLRGMKRYDGMMESMANETAEGLLSQLTDTFEVNIVRKWGQGLQDGAKKGLGTILGLIEDAEGALTQFGETVYEVGKTISNWLVEKLEKVVANITKVTGSFEFKEASLGKKISMLWKGVIVDPVKEWWEGGGREKTIETAGKVGKWIGETLTKGLLAIFGITDILKEDNDLSASGGASIAQSFAQGFVDGFDVSAVTDKLVEAISNVWNALPTWAKILVGGYAGGKVAGGISNFVGGVANFASGVKNTIGTFNIASSALPHLTSSGSGIAGALGKAGVGLGASTTGGALLAGTAGVAGGIAAGASLIKGGVDLYGSYKAYQSGDEIEGKAKAASGGSAIGGVAAGAGIGAAIGSVIPGLGTAVGALVGAGIGGVAGWIGGNKWAENIRKAKYEVEGTAEKIEEATTAEEKLAALNEAAWESMKRHMGDVKLSASEIERIADQIVWGDDIGNFDQFTSSVKAAEASLQSLQNSADDTSKWMWRASLGYEFDEDEIESFKASFDEYIGNAKSYVENKHYEFTAAVKMLVDVETEEGKSILESGDKFFTKIQEELGSLEKELQNTLDTVLKDGVISTKDKVKIKIDGVEYELNEQDAITKLQEKIAEITEKIANSEAHAEIELIKVKFGSGKLSLESFDSFMEQMSTTLSERLSNQDEAFKAVVSKIKLQLEEGAISQEEYDKQLKALIEGHEAKIESIRAEILSVELDIIGDAYEDVLGKDAAGKLQKALEKSLEEGINPKDWTVEDAERFLGIDNLKDDTAKAISMMLGSVADQLELIEVNGKLKLNLDIETDTDTKSKTEEKVEEEVKASLPETVQETVGVVIKGEKDVQNTIDLLVEDFGIEPEHAATVALLLTGDKQLLNKIDVSQLAKEFGIPEEQAKTVIEKLTGAKTIENRLKILASDFGVPDDIKKTIKVNLTAIKGSLTNLIGSVYLGSPGTQNSETKNPRLKSQGYGRGFRGGIFGGGSSAMESFALGGRPDDGMLKGSTRYIRVNEEHPEMIIPLSGQRRARGLKLWEKAGEMLGVPGFARGGFTNGSRDEGVRFNRYGYDEEPKGQTVQIDVGGITVEIQVDATGKENIAEAIKEQGEEIAETVAGILVGAFGAQFENTPTRGGIAY